MAAGIPDELYWRLTPVETAALLDAMAAQESRRERADTLRAGLVAAAVYNVHRRKGAPALRPSDFVKDSNAVKIVKPSELRSVLGSWAAQVNARQKRIVVVNR